MFRMTVGLIFSTCKENVVSLQLNTYNGKIQWVLSNPILPYNPRSWNFSFFQVDSIVKSSKKLSGLGGTIAEGEKKVCLWPIGAGTTCGKTFTKFDSLKRHLAETHKGVRPFACTLCEKTYGRRDYLQRHLKSHNASYAVNLASASGINASQVTLELTQTDQ